MRPLRTRVRYACPFRVERAPDKNSLAHDAKGTPAGRPSLVWGAPWIVLSASRFSAVARPARGSGFTVPSQYCSLSVSVGSRRWRRVPPYSDPGHGPYCHVRGGRRSVRADRPLWDPVPGGFPMPSPRIPVLSFPPPRRGKGKPPGSGGTRSPYGDRGVLRGRQSPRSLATTNGLSFDADAPGT